LVAAQDRESIPGVHIPNPCCIIGYATIGAYPKDGTNPRGQALAVRRERHIVNAFAWSAEDGQFLAGGRVPKPRRPVLAAGGQTPAIGRERHGEDPTLVALEDAQLPTTEGLEEMPFEAPLVFRARAPVLEIGKPAPNLGNGAALEVPVGGVDLGDVAEPLAL